MKWRLERPVQDAVESELRLLPSRHRLNQPGAAVGHLDLPADHLVSAGNSDFVSRLCQGQVLSRELEVVAADPLVVLGP